MDSATIARDIADYDTKRVNSVDALNEALSQFGVPEMRKTVAGLRTSVANTSAALDAVDPSVTGRTQNSLVTEAQRQRLVGMESAPIAKNLEKLGGTLNQSQADVSEAERNASTLATNRVNDWSAGRQALQSRYDVAYGREQDAARAAAEAESRRQAQANADREYQFSVTQANKPAAGSSRAPSAQENKAAVSGAIVGQMAKLTGKDGFVSNETWANALNDWVGSGYSTREFFQNFAKFVNPKYKTSYAGWANR